MEEKVIRLLSNLSAFNKLDKRVVSIITEVFKIDADELCKKYGITYFIKDTNEK